jgi:hypothetical protein
MSILCNEDTGPITPKLRKLSNVELDAVFWQRVLYHHILRNIQPHPGG